jgi:polygalacturonase
MKSKIFLVAALAFSSSLAMAESYAKPVHRTKQYLITKFGALADGKTMNTKAIQAAIDKCAATKKGGVVVVPAGTFLSGAIFLKQGVDLMVEKDGVLKGSTNIDDYPQIQTRWEGTEEMWTSAFINAEGVTGLTISGEGTIDGSGEEWVSNNPMRRPAGPRPAGAAGGPGAAAPGAATASAAPLAPPPPSPPAPPIPMVAAAPGAARPAGAAPAGPRGRGRPRLIGIQNSKEVLVSGIKLHNQAVWCLFVLYSQDVEIDGINITAEHNIPSSDGIDIDSSKHVHVNNVFIDDDDDCISIKSGKDADGLRVNRPAEDILIENSHFAYGQGGVAMGSEVSGGIRNVTVLNCVFDSGNWAPIRFKSQPSRGGVVENITYKNITLHGTRQAFEMNAEWRMVGPRQPDSNPLPVVRNVKIINVNGDVQSVGSIHGLTGAPIQGVTFENCNITANTGFKLDHARNVDLKGLTITVKQGEPVTETDVE